MPTGSNNPFGIKARVGEPFVEARTWEVFHGQNVTIVDKFRKFDSINDAFDQHGRTLATDRPYAKARALTGNPDNFAHALTGKYATDLDYGTKLKTIMKNYDLYRFN